MNIKLILTLFIFLTSFTIKDFDQFVDKAYGTDEPAPAAALGGIMGASREVFKKAELNEIGTIYEKIKEFEKKTEDFLNVKKECPAPTPKIENTKKGKSKEERELEKMRKTLFGRVWSDFSNLYSDDLEGDSFDLAEIKDEIKEYVKEETSDFLDEEFSELDAASLLALDFEKTGIDRELKVLNRRIRELTKGGRRLERSIDALESKKDKAGPDEAGRMDGEIEAKEKELTSVAMEFYAAKRMKHEIASGVEKRVKLVRDQFIAIQTRADEMKAYEEKMLGMAKFFQESDPMTRLLFLEMFPDLMQGDVQGSPQGFSLDIGSTPGGGLRLGFGAQGAENGFALNFSNQPADPFSQFFPNSTQNAGYGGYGQFGGDPFSVDPRQFGGSYFGQHY